MSNERENIRNRIDHIESHFNGTFRMIGTWFRQTRHTIVTIAENFYAQTMMILQKN